MVRAGFLWQHQVKGHDISDRSSDHHSDLINCRCYCRNKTIFILTSLVLIHPPYYLKDSKSGESKWGQEEPKVKKCGCIYAILLLMVASKMSSFLQVFFQYYLIHAHCHTSW